MTKDKVLKIAQDACPYFDEISKGAFYEGFITALDHFRGVRKLIKPDMGIDRGAWDDVPDATKWVDELRGGDETEQEPVAWCEINSIGEIMYFDGRAMIMPGKFGNDLHTVPLYTAPPKREWQGLTDEEIAEGAENSWVSKAAFESVAWWAEVKLKEKNRG